jgi:hypothetical protein
VPCGNFTVAESSVKQTFLGRAKGAKVAKDLKIKKRATGVARFLNFVAAGVSRLIF